jgi:hypothetical protein
MTGDRGIREAGKGEAEPLDVRDTILRDWNAQGTSRPTLVVCPVSGATPRGRRRSRR